MKVVVALAAALTAAGAAFVAAPSATAVECRLGWQYQHVTTVGGREVWACAPDNGPCPEQCSPPPTEAAPRD